MAKEKINPRIGKVVKKTAKSKVKTSKGMSDIKATQIELHEIVRLQLS